MASISNIIKKFCTRKDVKSAIYLQVIFDRVVKLISLKVFWFPDQFRKGVS